MNQTPHTHDIKLESYSSSIYIEYGDTRTSYIYFFPWEWYKRWRLQGIIKQTIHKHDRGSWKNNWVAEAVKPMRAQLTDPQKWGSHQLGKSR